MYDTEVEDIQLVQKSMKNTSAEVPAQERKSEAMDVVDTDFTSGKFHG